MEKVEKQKVMTRQEHIELLKSLGDGTQINIWVEVGLSSFTNIDFENEEVTETSIIYLPCGCCYDYEIETIKFSNLLLVDLIALIEELQNK